LRFIVFCTGVASLLFETEIEGSFFEHFDQEGVVRVSLLDFFKHIIVFLDKLVTAVVHRTHTIKDGFSHGSSFFGY